MPTNAGTSFPTNFLWGAATASYQIEGATHEDGRGESIWDRFAATQGKVRNGENGDIACGHYHRYREDVSLMRDLGVSAYRFSIAWPRILPGGRGQPNPSGLDFYDRLVDALLEHGIQPFATLYHWDLPQVLENQGGWPNRATVDAFAEYTEAVVRRLGDRVRNWITHNEPWCASWLGYGWGVHAPGRHSESAALAAAHHLLVSHGRAVEIIRGVAPQSRVGITLNLYTVVPRSRSDEDTAAARFEDGQRNRWFLDPIFHGAYPEDMLATFASRMPAVEPGDMGTVSTPIDFLGVNYYTRSVVGMGENGHPVQVNPSGSEYTAIGWEVYPEGLRDLLLRVQREYDPPALYITENGAAYIDVRNHDCEVNDPERIDYIARHLGAAREAMAGGARLRGYFVWSLLDNYEWARGYGNRFGIIYVDYPTLTRIPKSSYYWYRDFIAQQVSKTSAA